MPEDCVVCYNELKQTDILVCGHKVHISCVEKQFKPECPLCRTKLNIKVYGEKPEPDNYIPPERDIENNSDPEIDEFLSDLEELENELSRRKRRRDEEEEEGLYEEEEWQKKGYQYREEDSDYDEENPYGDECNYEN